MNPDTKDHRKRLRERFEKAAGDLHDYHDYEILELLLTFAIPRIDVKPQAKALIGRFGSLSGVLDASREDLAGVEGIGSNASVLLRLIRPLAARYLAEGMRGRDLVRSPKSAIDYARMKLSGLRHEVFLVLYLNPKSEVIADEILHEGTVDQSAVYPRKVIESALKHNATGLVFVHNHPSGHVLPSPQDRALTSALVDAARAVDLTVHDHIIVGRSGHYSFREEGFFSRPSSIAAE